MEARARLMFHPADNAPLSHCAIELRYGYVSSVSLLSSQVLLT